MEKVAPNFMQGNGAVCTEETCLWCIVKQETCFNHWTVITSNHILFSILHSVFFLDVDQEDMKLIGLVLFPPSCLFLLSQWWQYRGESEISEQAVGIISEASDVLSEGEGRCFIGSVFLRQTSQWWDFSLPCPAGIRAASWRCCLRRLQWKCNQVIMEFKQNSAWKEMRNVLF